jgi:hypothetical protein
MQGNKERRGCQDYMQQPEAQTKTRIVFTEKNGNLDYTVNQRIREVGKGENNRS